jgi:hypothetical protein
MGSETSGPQATVFETSVSIPLDEAGFFGRECPSCEGPFKMRHDEYEALPEELELTCPYCGHHEDHSGFMSGAQRARVMAAAEGLAEQWLHGQVNEMFGKTFGQRGGHSESFEVTYPPGTPPPLRELPDVLEEKTRRIIQCSVCGDHNAVYTATSFCPCVDLGRRQKRSSRQRKRRARRWLSRTVSARLSGRPSAPRGSSSASRSTQSNQR